MKFNINLLESDAEIRQQILTAIRATLSKAFVATSRELPSKIKPLIIQALKTEPEYQSLISGQLRDEFGIADVSAVDRVIDRLVDTLTVSSKPITISNRGLSGSITINLIKSDDIGGVIYTEDAVVKDEKNGYSLPWLEWLLLKGNEIIINNFTVKFGPSPASRSGNAVMVSSNNSWRVPPQFVGTADNNWTTRALDKISQNIEELIQTTLESHI